MGIEDKKRLKLIEKEAKRLAAIAVPGLHRVEDGRRGLYLQIRSPKARSWLYRFTVNGRLREMGLGSEAAVPLTAAVEDADAARLLHARGIDPLDERRAEKTAQRLDAAKDKTFKEVAQEYVAAHSPSWKNAKHRQQWENTLATYVYPKIGSLPIQAIDVASVLDIIRPIWLYKTETASRIRGRIKLVIDYATPTYRIGDNPANWDILKSKLPKRAKISKVEHHAALPYADIAAFVADLRGRGSLSARALEITILTAGRASEVLGAEWSEIDFDAGVWTVPAERMKAGKEHKVPLSARAVEILRDLYSRREGALVFPGQQSGKPLSGASLSKLLDLMGRTDLTVHGFRSTFRDWAAERTNFPNEVCEMALAHAIPDKVEAAYRRGDLFEKRRRLMAAWGDFCRKQIETSAASGEVVPLRV
jgi:integrase